MCSTLKNLSCLLQKEHFLKTEMIQTIHLTSNALTRLSYNNYLNIPRLKNHHVLMQSLQQVALFVANFYKGLISVKFSSKTLQ